MGKPVFERKIYNEILDWKENRSDKYALLIKGARRVGKSTIVEDFAKREFRSYIMIDFAHISKAIKDLFDDTYDLEFFFLQLQQLTGIRLYVNESVIIFDEVQLFPKARQAIKYLVADGRYKYIETGSLISIKKNTKDILIPSEEHKISMYPMDLRSSCGRSATRFLPGRSKCFWRKRDRREMRSTGILCAGSGCICWSEECRRQ